MRLIILVLLLTQLSLGLLWLFPGPSGRQMDELIPEGVVGLMVLRNPPDLDELLTQIEIDDWIDLNPAELQQKIPESLRSQLSLIFRSHLEESWIFLHRLERKEDGALRIHFSALLRPKPNHRTALELLLRIAAYNLFGAPNTRVVEEENVTLYQGSEPEQTLFQARMPEYLLISNSRPGWLETLQTAAGRRPSLAQSYSYRKITGHLPLEQGVFLYINARRFLPLLPEFGYRIQGEAGELTNQSYHFPRRAQPGWNR